MKNKKVSLVELFNKAPMFEKVMDLLNSKKFIDPGDPCPDGMIIIGVMSPRPDGMIIIGVMSPLERACYSLLQESKEKFDEAMVEDCFFTSLENLLLLTQEYPYQQDIHEFMFGLIQSRMEKNYPDLENIFLHEGFRILTSSKIDVPETIEVFEGLEKMSVDEMIEIRSKNTFLEPIIEVFESEEFIDCDSPIQDGEEFIREMSSLEKTLRTMYVNLFEEQKQKSEEIEKLIEASDVFHPIGMILFVGIGAPEVGMSFAGERDHPDVILAENLQEKIALLASRLEQIDSFFWHIVQSDIPKETFDVYGKTGVRKGFKIVLFNRQ